MTPESSSTTSSGTRRRPSKVPCEICGLLFDTLDIKEEHKKFQMLKDIILLQPYLSSYYEATKYIIIDKEQSPKYPEENSTYSNNNNE